MYRRLDQFANQSANILKGLDPNNLEKTTSNNRTFGQIRRPPPLSGRWNARSRLALPAAVIAMPTTIFRITCPVAATDPTRLGDGGQIRQEGCDSLTMPGVIADDVQALRRRTGQLIKDKHVVVQPFGQPGAIVAPQRGQSLSANDRQRSSIAEPESLSAVAQGERREGPNLGVATPDHTGVTDRRNGAIDMIVCAITDEIVGLARPQRLRQGGLKFAKESGTFPRSRVGSLVTLAFPTR